MDIIPAALRPLLAELAPAFTRPSLRRFSLLAAAAVLTAGRHTVSNLLRRVSGVAAGDASGYRRVLSAARWSEARAGRHLARLIVGLLPADVPVVLVGDDTVTSHPGAKVHGKAKHRDQVRSSRGFSAWRWGHRRVVLAVLVRFPFASRPWALPIAAALYRSEAGDRAEGRRHRTPAQLMRALLALTPHRFPDRRFVFVGDSGFGTHELAVWVSRRRRLELVSKAQPELRLYGPPPAYRGSGLPGVRPAAGRRGPPALPAAGGRGVPYAAPSGGRLVRRRPAAGVGRRRRGDLPNRTR